MAKKILIIEDDLDVIDTLKLILSAHAFQLDVAFDGRQGVQKIKLEKPDLLILDLTMPVMDGWAVMIAMKNNPEYSSIPIMVLTSHREADHVEKAKKLGVNAFLTKPFDPAKVIKVARHLTEPESGEAASDLGGLLWGDILHKDGL